MIVNVKKQVKKQSLYNLSLNLSVNNKDEANKAKDAFEVLKALREAGATNLMYCLAWRKNATSRIDKRAVSKVGIRRTKKAFDFFAREFGKVA
jgi:hypothetical protein